MKESKFKSIVRALFDIKRPLRNLIFYFVFIMAVVMVFYGLTEDVREIMRENSFNVFVWGSLIIILLIIIIYLVYSFEGIFAISAVFSGLGIMLKSNILVAIGYYILILVVAGLLVFAILRFWKIDLTKLKEKRKAPPVPPKRKKKKTRTA